MLRHMFILPLIALSFNGVADTVRATNARTSAASQESQSSLPNLNIEAGCQDVAKNDLNKTTDYPGCFRKSARHGTNCERSGRHTRPTCTANACIL